MNRVFRNLFFYGVIFLVLIAVIGLFNGQNKEVKDFKVHEFMQALDNGEIKEVTMQPVNKIMRFTGKLEKGDVEFIAQVPDNTDVIATITQKASDQNVLKVAQEEQPSAFVSVITMMLPFLIIG